MLIDIKKFDKGRTRLKKTLEGMQEIELDELQELFRLDEISAKKGGSCPGEIAIDVPVYFDDFVLYRPGIGCMIFLDTYVKQWFEDDAINMIVFMALCLQYGREPKKLYSSLGTKERAIKAINEASIYMCCTIEELQEAVTSCYAGFPEVGKVDENCDSFILAQASSFAEALGPDIDFWFWSQSAQKVMWLHREQAEVLAKENNAFSPGRSKAIQGYLQFEKQLKKKYGIENNVN